jgi:hypothetical protein
MKQKDNTEKSKQSTTPIPAPLGGEEGKLKLQPPGSLEFIGSAGDNRLALQVTGETHRSCKT